MPPTFGKNHTFQQQLSMLAAQDSHLGAIKTWTDAQASCQTDYTRVSASDPGLSADEALQLISLCSQV